MGRVTLGIRYSSYPLKRQQQLNYGSDIRSGQERKSFKQYFSDLAFNSKRQALKKKKKRIFYLSDTQLWRRAMSSPLAPFVQLCAIRMRLWGLKRQSCCTAKAHWQLLQNLRDSSSWVHFKLFWDMKFLYEQDTYMESTGVCLVGRTIKAHLPPSSV